MMTFSIPSKRDDLLKVTVVNSYSVKDVLTIADIPKSLEDAYSCLRDEGPNFILENFDTYFSVLHNLKKLRIDVVHKAYKHLLKTIGDLKDNIRFLLDDKDSLNDEVKSTTVNIIKMLVYIFVQFVYCLEDQKKKTLEENMMKGKKNDAGNENFFIDKLKVLNSLTSIIQQDIHIFWDPPIVEDDFIKIIFELCLYFLKNPSIKQEKNFILDVFGVFGHLIKSYNCGENFVSRLLSLIRECEHVVHCAPEGIKLIVEQFNCASLIHHLVKGATEWQESGDEMLRDEKFARSCSTFLIQLGVTVPDLILPEILYLNKYLAHDSIHLRTAILNIIFETILQVLTKHDLTDEEKEMRDEFFEVMLEHLNDFSGIVRGKVIQNFSKLQKENAIPLNYQNEVFTLIIRHLCDKVATVRKNAINCVTIFLQHNPYGADLQLGKCEQLLIHKKELVDKMESAYKEAQMEKLKQEEEKWDKIKDDLETVIKEQLQNDDNDDDEEEEEQEKELDTETTINKIREFLNEQKFQEVFVLCKKLKNETVKNAKETTTENEVKIYMTLLRSFFINVIQIVQELQTHVGMTEEDVMKIKELEKYIKYLEGTITFLKLIDSAIGPMKTLLFSQTIGDTHEAIEFFVTAYQFNIDRASEGILEMLKLMRCTDLDRQKAVIEAFKSIYLVTDARTMEEHTTTILNRLIALIKEITYFNLQDIQSIIAEWTIKGILDNSVIDRCWQYYTQRERVSNDDARAVAIILRMAATGRESIVKKNINLITKIMFSDVHRNDLLFLASSCRMLTVATSQKIDIQSDKNPFRIKYNDTIFNELSEILVQKFFEKCPFYSEALQAGLDFIFKASSNPIENSNKILEQISEKLNTLPKTNLLVHRYLDLLGYVALYLLIYLDNSVYRESKRRFFVQEERLKKKNEKKTSKTPKKKNNKSLMNTSFGSDSESYLAGADAEDTQAEYIMHVLENELITPKSVFGQYSGAITKISSNPDLYKDAILQKSAVTTLMRLMLVASKFCKENIRLIFTFLEKTDNPSLRSAVLVHSSDLLTRFSNIVEPWSPRFYNLLKDPLEVVRSKAFYALANLILRDMIRAHSHISEMAACLVDDFEEVSQMCKDLFGRLAQKENYLTNVIPDIFTHLVRADDISEDKLRYIFRFLFDLVDNSKRMENVVDRLCSKYSPDDNVRLNRNITYCLSLVIYNEKTLKKLREKFPLYQHHLHDAEIYSLFKQILADCTKAKSSKADKNDLKPIVTEFESCIASVFEINPDGKASKPPPVIKSAKKTRGRPAKKSKKRYSSADEDDDDERPIKTRTKSVRKRSRNSSDDSD